MTKRDPAQFEDRRSESRTTTVYRPVLIESDEIAGFGLLRNISSGGMMGKFYTDLAEDTAVTVQFNAFLEARGKVSRSNGGVIGIEFDDPIDVPNVLLGLSSSPVRGKINRAPRLQIQAQVQIVVDARTAPVEVHDISQKGLKVRSSFLRTAEEVTVLMDGLKPKRAMVRWTQPGLAGLNFIQPLAFDQLGEWVIRQHQKVEQASEKSESVETQWGNSR